MAYKVTGFDIIDDTRRIINASVAGIGTTIATTGSTKLYVEGASFTSGIATALRFVSGIATGTAPISVASSTLVSTLNVEFLNGKDEAFFRNASNLNAGAVPGAQVTQSNGLVVSGNLNVSGNVTIGGSITQTNVSQLRISDKDITLGITTDVNGNDVSTDITANHGGIAIASTEGTPLVNIPSQAGINTDPSTYKQIMWIRSGNYGGFNTDAWVFNYGVSIGNTASVLNGSRLTVGAGFTVYDTYLELADIRSRYVTSSGISTFGGVNLPTGNSYQINGTSVLSNNTLGSNVVNSSLTSVGTLSNLSVSSSGVTTVGFLTASNLFVAGIGTFATIRPTNITDTNGTNGATNSFLSVVGAGITWVTIGGLVGGNIATATRAVSVDVNTTTNLNGNILLGVTGIGTSVFADANLTYNAATDVLGVVHINSSGVTTTTALNVSGVTTTRHLSVTGVTTLGFVTATNSFVSGFTTSTSFAISNAAGNTTVLTTTNSQISLSGIATIDATTRATLERELAFAPNDFDTLNVSGISTLASTTLIGGGTSTGTLNQRLQVTGGAYISGALGIGTTNPFASSFQVGAGVSAFAIVGSATSVSIGIGTTTPTRNLDVNGDVRLRSAVYDFNNNVGVAGSILISTGAGVSWSTLTGAGAISGITITDDNTGVRYPVFTSATSGNVTGQFVDSSGIVYNTLTNSLGILTTAPVGNLQVGTGVTAFTVVGSATTVSVGVGTTNPTQNLDVNGNVRLRNALFDYFNTPGTTGQFLTVQGNGIGVSWTTISGVSGGTISLATRATTVDTTTTTTNSPFYIPFVTNNASTNGETIRVGAALSINPSTNTLFVPTTIVGSAVTSSNGGINVTGIVTATSAFVGAAVTINNSGVSVTGVVTATDFNSSSDRTLKHDIQVIQNPIEKVVQLNGVSFSWNETGRPSIGVIAQEVEQVFPELVSDTDPKSVNYNGLIGLLIECVKEQQKQIDELKQVTAKKPRKPKSA